MIWFLLSFPSLFCIVCSYKYQTTRSFVARLLLSKILIRYLAIILSVTAHITFGMGIEAVDNNYLHLDIAGWMFNLLGEFCVLTSILVLFSVANESNLIIQEWCHGGEPSVLGLKYSRFRTALTCMYFYAITASVVPLIQ